MKPAGWLLVGALLGGAWAVPGSGAQAPDGGAAVPAPAPVAAPATQPASGAVTNVPEAPRALRDPFWPLGYTPGQTTNMVAVPTPGLTHTNNTPAVDAQALARSQIHVDGLVEQGTQAYAIINGRLTGVGDVINIQTPEGGWRFVLRRIKGREVIIEPLP